jgi:hypothetical protein
MRVSFKRKNGKIYPVPEKNYLYRKLLQNSLSNAYTSHMYGQFSVKTPTPVHPLLKVRKLWQIWFIFSLQDVFERKKYKNGKKNSMKLVR